MKRIILFLCAIVASSVHAESFEARAQLGEAAEDRGEFKSYFSTMYKEIGEPMANIMRICFKNTLKPDSANFVLVADIEKEGNLDSIEVKPATNIAKCFAAGLIPVSFPKPPEYPKRHGFPLTIKMKITP